MIVVDGDLLNIVWICLIIIMLFFSFQTIDNDNFFYRNIFS